LTRRVHHNFTVRSRKALPIPETELKPSDYAGLVHNESVDFFQPFEHHGVFREYCCLPNNRNAANRKCLTSEEERM